MTQAVILAAGRGRRLLKLTETHPKCLVKLAGKPIIEWQMEALKKAGITNIVIVGGYLSDILKNRELPLILNAEWSRTNMVESLYCAHHILCEKETIVCYGDIAYHSEIIEALLCAAGDIVITYDLWWQHLWQGRFCNPLEDAESFRIFEGKVIEIGQVPQTIETIQGQFMGLLKFTSEGWATVSKKISSLAMAIRKKMEMTTLLQLLIESKFSVHGVPIKGRWCEVDRQEDLAYYEQKLQEGGQWSHDWRY